MIEKNKKFLDLTNSDPKLMQKLSKYYDVWDKSKSDPLEDSAGKYKLIKVFSVDGINTSISDIEIRDFVVLKEGTIDDFGWKHITRDKRLEEFKKYYAKYRGLCFCDEEQLNEQILKELEIALKYGEIIFEKNEYKVAYNGIFISINKEGSINTAYPTNKYSKRFVRSKRKKQYYS